MSLTDLLSLQVLAYLGALEYSPEFNAKLAAKELLPPGSPMEVESRGATILACRKVTEALKVGVKVDMNLAIEEESL